MDEEAKPNKNWRFVSRSFVFTIVGIFLAVAGFILWMIIPYWSQMNFQRRLKHRATAAELHAWASRTLAPYQRNYDPALWILITNLPPVFQGLDKWPPRAYVRSDSESRFNYNTAPVPYIWIIYGSAAGHFGVVFGPTNLPTPPDREHEITYSVWQPGIWFFNSQ